MPVKWVCDVCGSEALARELGHMAEPSVMRLGFTDNRDTTRPVSILVCNECEATLVDRFSAASKQEKLLEIARSIVNRAFGDKVA